jgi:hypothetical protein
VVVLVELRPVRPLRDPVEVRERVGVRLAGIVLRLPRPAQQVVDQRPGVALLLEVERGRVRRATVFAAARAAGSVRFAMWGGDGCRSADRSARRGGGERGEGTRCGGRVDGLVEHAYLLH